MRESPKIKPQRQKDHINLVMEIIIDCNIIASSHSMGENISIMVRGSN